METTLNLIHILIPDAKINYAWRMYYNESEFTKDLEKFHPLLNIKTIFIMYRLDINTVLQFEIKPTIKKEPNKFPDSDWDVYVGDRLFFLFNCNRGDTFYKIFKEKLIKELKKQSPGSPLGRDLDSQISDVHVDF